jgi:hypothetical protein
MSKSRARNQKRNNISAKMEKFVDAWAESIIKKELLGGNIIIKSPGIYNVNAKWSTSSGNITSHTITANNTVTTSTLTQT